VIGWIYVVVDIVHHPLFMLFPFGTVGALPQCLLRAWSPHPLQRDRRIRKRSWLALSPREIKGKVYNRVMRKIHYWYYIISSHDKGHLALLTKLKPQKIEYYQHGVMRSTQIPSFTYYFVCVCARAPLLSEHIRTYETAFLLAKTTPGFELCKTK